MSDSEISNQLKISVLGNGILKREEELPIYLDSIEMTFWIQFICSFSKCSLPFAFQIDICHAKGQKISMSIYDRRKGNKMTCQPLFTLEKIVQRPNTNKLFHQNPQTNKQKIIFRLFRNSNKWKMTKKKTSALKLVAARNTDKLN